MPLMATYALQALRSLTQWLHAATALHAVSGSDSPRHSADQRILGALLVHLIFFTLQDRT